jgi:hypothetical protein
MLELITLANTGYKHIGPPDLKYSAKSLQVRRTDMFVVVLRKRIELPYGSGMFLIQIRILFILWLFFLLNRG